MKPDCPHCGSSNTAKYTDTNIPYNNQLATQALVGIGTAICQHLKIQPAIGTMVGTMVGTVAGFALDTVIGNQSPQGFMPFYRCLQCQKTFHSSL